MVQIISRHGDDCPVTVEITESEFELVKIATIALPKSVAVTRLWQFGDRSTKEAAAIVDAAIADNISSSPAHL